jgi:uncharacterized protein (TIGR03437 family)
MVTPDGTYNTIAGTGDLGFAGDGGPAAMAQLDSPAGVAADSQGNIFVADSGNQRVRKLEAAQITPGGVVNAASFVPGPIAPGEMITIFGSNIGPSTPATSQVTAGLVSTQLAQTQVLVDGTPAPLIYVSATQITAMVPYAVAGKSSVSLQIQYQGNPTNKITLPVAATAPGLFTASGSGIGQGAFLNQDGSPNSATNTAAKGSIVVLYGTGEGQTTPPGMDGKLATDTLPKPAAPVSVTIGGIPVAADGIPYAGTAPGGVAGFLQVNVTVPAGVASGPGPVVLTIGGSSSPAGVTLAVR